MHAGRLIVLGMSLAAMMPVAAAEEAPAYSLDDLKSIARSAHPTLESAAAAVEAARELLRQSRAWPNPELDLDLGRGRPRGGGKSRTETGIALTQPVELPGIRRWRATLAEVRLRGAEMERAVAETAVDSAVSALATGVMLGGRRTELARESAGIASRLHGLLARRAEAGESSPLEVARARAEWFARRKDLLDEEASLDAARSALRLFCGNALEPGFRLSGGLRERPAEALPGDLAERLRERNPVLQRARTAVEEARARAELARKEVFPEILLSAGRETELDRTAAGIGIGLTLPLWNRNRGSVAAAVAGQAAASGKLRGLAMELETSLERAMAAYRRALQAVRLHQEGWTATARRSLDIAGFSFENGEASLLEVLDAQRAYLEVSLAEAEAWAGLAVARADIERLIAGPLDPEDQSDDR